MSEVEHDNWKGVKLITGFIENLIEEITVLNVTIIRFQSGIVRG